MIYIVTSSKNITEAKNIILGYDNNAFIVVNETKKAIALTAKK